MFNIKASEVKYLNSNNIGYQDDDDSSRNSDEEDNRSPIE